MPLYTYSCGEHTTESIRPVGTGAIACHCGQEAKRLPVYAVSRVTPDIRYRGRDFLEASAEIAERADEMSKREGVPVKTPDYFSMAVDRAKRLRAAGVTSSRDLR